MRPKHLVSIVLIAVVLVMLMRNNNSMTNARPLVYRESLDEVAAQINGETLTLRDMAFYVGYEEYQIQQEALVYDPDDPNRYWSMRVEGGFMNAVARKNAMQMALHDELFYQMAMEEGITLDDNDQKHMDNKLEDFWEDLTERQGETALGISRKDAKKTIQRIAPNVTDKQIQQAIHDAHLVHYVRTLPGGLDYYIEDGNTISGGQRQLITIARAMIKNAPLLILDEATSNVDTRTEEKIEESMDRLTKGRTSFVIAHRLSTIRNADLILVMKDGNIIEQGTHDSLMNQNGFYASLYNSQFSME